MYNDKGKNLLEILRNSSYFLQLKIRAVIPLQGTTKIIKIWWRLCQVKVFAHCSHMKINVLLQVLSF